MDRFVRLTLPALACLGLLSVSVGRSEDKLAFDDASLEFFEKEVRPILVTRCFECHSGGARTPKGGLRLDSREALLKGGDTGLAVTPGDPAKSLLVSAINYGDLYQMPPKSKLPAGEIAVLTKWVGMGLPWPKETSSVAGTVKPFDLAARAAEHWCWNPVKDSEPPTITQKDWPVSTVDRFILARLESRRLSPAPPADPRALLRRVYFDLVGLPPSPEEVEEFSQDQGPHAFERVVDRLLGSVQFGERWGRHWLDLTRYAETRGHEFEPIIPNAWQYRDYVIRALNADVPYDRFLTEHIAGDLVEPRWRAVPDRASQPVLPINESLLGTGFWFLGEEVHSPVDIRKDETDRIDNRLDVMSKTFLGLTVACARCHDHKFDAISQRDYYALAGFAISGSYRQIRIDTFEQHRQIARQLDEHRAQARQAVTKSVLEITRPVLDKLDLYWLVAMRALDGDPSISTSIAAGELPLAAPVAETIKRLAKENSLDARRLELWCAEFVTAKTEKKHPLHRLLELASEAPSNSPIATEARPGLVVDFGDPLASSPIQDGVSFGLRPVEGGRLEISGTPEIPTLRVATVGGWDRDLFWKNLKLAPNTDTDYGTLGTWRANGRMVRSPEFTLTARNVWYLVRGSVRAYATVNSHLVIGGPLHGGLMREFKHDDTNWHWVAHGLDLYQGHRLHVEFSPVDDAPCTIAMVVQSDEQPKPLEPNWNWIYESIARDESMAQILAACQKKFREAANLLARVNGPHPTASESSLPSNTIATGSKASTAELAHLADWIVTHRPLFSGSNFERPPASLRDAEAELAKQVQWESTLAPAMLDGNGVDEYLLVRGNSNTPKEHVSRRFLEAFHGGDRETASKTSQESQPATPAARPGSGRLELANEILHSPLAPRVAVNRIWHHLFGRGIVPTVDNLGVLGLPPSHPELLDHLATQFVRDGWSTKALIRSLVLSRTYQMSSHSTSADVLDPNNELWHRMPIKRLEGEAIRDSLLAVSGRLDRTSFGPSVPIHLTEFMQGRGRPGGSGPLDGNGRRSIYIAVRRNFLSPMMLAFDTPSPFSTVGRRTVSNVPAQALILMNDPFVIEQAKRWADRLLADSSQTNEQRLDRMYLTAFARHATPAETSEAIGFLNSQGATRNEDQNEAWKNLCHVMFNVKEFVFIE